MTSEDSGISNQGGTGAETIARRAAAVLVAGLIVGSVLVAVTAEVMWIGLGLAFGPAAGVAFGALLVVSFPRRR